MRASFWQRFASALIDEIACRIFNAVWSIIVILLFLSSASQGALEAVQKHGNFTDSVDILSKLPFSMRIALSMCVLTPCVYYFSEVFFGRSLGKKIMGLRIRNEDGSYLDLAPGLVRWAIKCCPEMLFAFAIVLPNGVMMQADRPLSALLFLGWLVILFPGRAALHDRISRTAVVPNDVPYSSSNHYSPGYQGKRQRDRPTYDTW